MRNPALNIAIKAARQGGTVLSRLFARFDQVGFSSKQQHDFVSDADHAAEAAIIEEIHKAHPDHAILAEESGEVKGRSGGSECVWVIDPLDGTQNFLRGIPHFCSSIALKERGMLQVAVIYDPIRDELFTASRGAGAVVNDHKMRVTSRNTLNGALLGTGFPFRERDYMAAYLGMFADLFDVAADARRAGSAALDLAYVAAGRLDGFWEIGLKPWDTAAGALLIREAGGICTDFAGGGEFVASGNIIAGNLKVAGAIRNAIAPHLIDGIRN